jgi:hypothetical protein
MLRLTFRFGLPALALVWGCGGRSSGPGTTPPVDVDGGETPVMDAGVADDATVSAGGDSAIIVGMACSERGAVTPAPLDTAAPAAPTGPYLWKNVSIVAGGFVTGIVFSPAQKDVVYARTDIGGAYRWNAAANRWIPLLDWMDRSQGNWTGVESIAADPVDANKVYVAGGTYVTSGPGVILWSSDQGRSFHMTATSIPMGGNNDGRSVGERLAVDPNDTRVLYFGSRTTGLWKSSDYAVSFDNVPLPGLIAVATGGNAGPATTPNGVGISFVQFDAYTCGADGKTVVYVGVAMTGPSLYRSTDGGATWEAVPGQPTALMPSHAALSATGMLYVTYGGGTGTNGSGPSNVTTGAVYRLNTRNGTWTDVTPVPGATMFGYAGVSVDAAHPETLVVSTLDRWATGDDIYRSLDSGAHWTPVGVPSAAHDISAAPWVTFHQQQPNFTGWMADVEIDPFNPARVLHVTGQGIWGTDDMTAADSNQPTRWDFRSVGIEETAVLDLASPPSGPHLFSAVGDIGGFRHMDLDASPVEGMSSNPVFGSTDSIDFAEANPSIVARVGRGGAATAAHGSFSIDGGATWRPFPAAVPVGNNAGSIAISADATTFVWDPPAVRGATPSPGGPQYSRDQGLTWTASTGIGAIRPVIADRVNPNKFYAFEGNMGRLWVSTDQASTFAVAATGLPTGGNTRLRATPGIEGDLWLVAGGTPYHSADSGATFAPNATASGTFALGLGMAPPGQTYPAVFIGGTVNGTVGIFRSDDAGVRWTQVDDEQHQFATASVIVGDPRVYGRVYVGTNGRGILYGDLVTPAQ